MESDLETTDLPPAPLQTSRRMLPSRYLLGAAVAGFALLFLVVWWNTRLVPEDLENAADLAIAVDSGVSVVQSDRLIRLQRAVEAAGFAQQVRVVGLSQDKFQLIGVVVNEVDLDNVLRAASSVTRKLVPNVLIQTEFTARLRAVALQLPDSVTVEALPVGVVSLRHDPARGEVLTEAKRLIQQELPELVAFQLETALAAATPVPPHDNEARALQQRLKKKIAAIQSGPNAYVLLASGQKIMPGGGVDNHQLLSIDDQSLLFQDARGNTIRVQR